ncbi:MAG: leucine-rich repeat domain-containing protein [Muribaculaceae bacterium]|nr:leucine-rich repeat domain-containing protein [Muribaculaceae bacterium]
MKKILLLLMAIAMVAMSSSASTKIYVCGTKITGTTSFQAGGGTVSYNNNTRELTINNVDYTKSGSSNNGISVDEVDGDLTIYLKGTVKFTIGDADAVLCKDANKHKTTINVYGTSTFISKSSGHAGLKLQDCDVDLQGSGTLNIENTSSSSSANAIKGGTRSENLDFKIKNCTVESNGPRFYNLYEVTFRYTSYYDTGDYISRSTLITLKPGSSNTVHAKDVTSLNDYYTHIFLPIDYYSKNIYLLKESDLSGKEVQISDYVPAVKINASKFPDANLFNHLRYLEPQGWLTTSAMNAYTYLNISDLNISSLEGLSQFANLKELRCNNNNLTNLYDVPTSIQTLNCSNNKITSFNYLQNCSSLKTLNCSNNQISSLNNLPTNIESLDCSSNKFTNLYFDNTTGAVEHWYTRYPNLRTLNCSNNTQLTEIWNNDNTGNGEGSLTSLNVTGCTSLTRISCEYNKISSLSSLPSSLKSLNLPGNQLTSLPTLPSGLEYLGVYKNKLTSFSLSNHSSIKNISIGANPLTTLTIINNSNLEHIYAYYTTSSCTIDCINNSKLTTLNVEESTGLKTLNCYRNSALTTLVVTNCSSLTTLQCYNNKLTSLNLTGCSALTSLDCHNNQITSFTSLPTTLQTIYCNDNKLSGGTFDVSGRSALKTLNISNNPNFSGLKCNNCSLTSLSVSGCTGLTTLTCNNNQLTSLDVSSLSNLTLLYCYDNKLTSLNVSNKTKLGQLQAYRNQLTSINVQGCSALQNLGCAENKLSSLSVQGCNALTTLNCWGNQIKGSAMTSLINTLRTIPAGSTGDLDVIYPGQSIEGNVITDAQIRTARNKRWIPKKYVSGSGWVEIPVSSAIPGDVNGDGDVTSADITALYDYLLNGDTSSLQNGDQNGDGDITSSDITTVYNILLGN